MHVQFIHRDGREENRFQNEDEEKSVTESPPEFAGRRQRNDIHKGKSSSRIEVI